MRKTKGNKLKHMFIGLLSILDGLIRFLTLGFYWSSFQFKFIFKHI